MNSTTLPKTKLIVIDDEEGVLNALRLMLSAFGFEVHPYSKPHEGIEAIATVQPDWIISDLRMPEIDGFAVLEYRNEHHSDIPFMLISGHATGREIEKAKALGAQAVLQKPFDPQQLLEIVRAHKDSNAAQG
ncbi:MAG: response regulator [Bdellovibrionales bacterium]|nr:response regulator [Bdellovibrionales bacterium]